MPRRSKAGVRAPSRVLVSQNRTTNLTIWKGAMAYVHLRESIRYEPALVRGIGSLTQHFAHRAANDECTIWIYNLPLRDVVQNPNRTDPSNPGSISSTTQTIRLPPGKAELDRTDLTGIDLPPKLIILNYHQRQSDHPSAREVSVE